MYDRILVPVDGSDEAEAALAVAARLPARAVRLLRVDPLDGGDGGVAPDAESPWRTFRTKEFREEMARSAARFPALSDRIEFAVRFGDPADKIIADAATADLVVMTTHGRGTAGRLIFGSVADRVARHGTTPTLLIRSVSTSAPPTVATRIVVPLDGSPLAEQALPEASKLAQALGLPIRLVRVVDLEAMLATIRFELFARKRGDLAGEAYDLARRTNERIAAEYLAQHAERLRAEDIAAETVVRTGSPVFVLLEMLQPKDVVAMTTHGHGGIQRWLIGSVAEKLVREAPCPVLLARPAKPSGGPRGARD